MREACGTSECAVLVWRVVRELYVQTGMNYDKHQIDVVSDPAALNTGIQLQLHRVGLKIHVKTCSGEDGVILPEIRVGVCIPGVMWLHCTDTHCRRWISLVVLTQERLGDNLKS